MVYVLKAMDKAPSIVQGGGLRPHVVICHVRKITETQLKDSFISPLFFLTGDLI